MTRATRYQPYIAHGRNYRKSHSRSICSIQKLSERDGDISQLCERHELDGISEDPVAWASLPNPLADQGHEGISYCLVENLGHIMSTIQDVVLIRDEYMQGWVHAILTNDMPWNQKATPATMRARMRTLIGDSSISSSKTGRCPGTSSPSWLPTCRGVS